MDAPRFDANSLAATHQRKADLIYVIYSKERNSVLFDPMTNAPVSSIYPNTLHETAKKFKGIIVTVTEAIKLVIKNTPHNNSKRRHS